MILLFLFCIFFLHADLEDHFKKPLEKKGNHAMRNIDFIYMINLDQRPEKWKMSIDQLSPFGIHPYRFSAVNGWELTLSTILDIGVVFSPEMQGGFWATTFRLKRPGESPHPEVKEGHCGNSYPFYGDFIWEQKQIDHYGTVYFAHCMERGTLGCILSHLSVLHDAYKSGYETIWVMEDDIEVIKDPRILSDLIDRLDQIDPNWDVLFTDQDIRNHKGEYVPAYSCARRPDYISPNDFALKQQVSADFRKIGARYGSHSMILRKKGIQKLLQFFLAHKIFLPYDLDYTLPVYIRLYAVNADVVSNLCRALSDNGHPRYLENSKTP